MDYLILLKLSRSLNKIFFHGFIGIISQTPSSYLGLQMEAEFVKTKNRTSVTSFNLTILLEKLHLSHLSNNTVMLPALANLDLLPALAPSRKKEMIISNLKRCREALLNVDEEL